MNIIRRSFIAALLTCAAVHGAEPVEKQFLRHVYGADGTEISAISVPSDDLWMLRGAKNAAALAEIQSLKINTKPDGITSGVIGSDVYFIETRGGKVDPSFYLEAIHSLHRQLVLRFVFAVLTQDAEDLGRLTTDARKVELTGRRTAGGDMEQYASIVALIPVLRASNPAEDAKRRTVTYRIPLGEKPLSLTLVKSGSTWKVDTANGVRVPVEFFHQ